MKETHKVKLSQIMYDVSLTNSLPKRDIILRSKSNKRKLASVLSAFSMGGNVTMESKDDGAFSHDEKHTSPLSPMFLQQPMMERMQSVYLAMTLIYSFC